MAAKIVVDRGGEVPVVKLTGTMESSDSQKLVDAIAGLRKAIVSFSSEGGDLDAGLDIGKTIRLKNFTTIVPDGAECASACALAWLGGTTRYMGRNARIGFHAAYVERGHRTQESGVGNALVGSYLNSIGLSEEAVIYMTSPHPNEIQWLTLDDARTMGIEVVTPPAKPASPQRAEPADTPLQRQAKPAPAVPQTALKQAARDFIGDYYDHWSDIDARTIAYFRGLYAETVDFHGKATRRQAVVDMKQDFVARWPTRVFALRTDSLAIDCDRDRSDCVIKGLVDWECLNGQRGAKSAGVSDFAIGVTFLPFGAVRVYREDGSPISKGRQP